MKIVCWSIVWIIGWFVTIILMFLIDRIRGISPDKVYDEESQQFCVLLLIIWPIIFPFLIGYMIFKSTMKYSIAIVEIIVAIRNAEDKEEEEPMEVQNK